jgi:hypothetical protein
LSFCPFFFWPLYFLSFFDLQILVTLLASSNSSYHTKYILQRSNTIFV